MMQAHHLPELAAPTSDESQASSKDLPKGQAHHMLRILGRGACCQRARRKVYQQLAEVGERMH